MKKHTRILVAITFLLGLGVAANAETHAELNVTLPFEFVAGKTTLPAGKYIVKRISEQPFDVLMITCYPRASKSLTHTVGHDAEQDHKQVTAHSVKSD